MTKEENTLILEEFDDGVIEHIGNPREYHEKVKLFLAHTIDRVREEERERLREYVESEKEQDESALTCDCDGSGSDLGGYCNCGFTRQDTLDSILYSLTQKDNE